MQSAINESAPAMSNFRLYRSAQTPAKGASKRLGRKLQRMEMVIIEPDWVVRVMCHMIVYATRLEPKKETT